VLSYCIENTIIFLVQRAPCTQIAAGRDDLVALPAPDPALYILIIQHA
jgi:hypothetical protein